MIKMPANKKTHHKLGKLYEMLLPPLDIAPFVRYDVEESSFDNKPLKFLKAVFNKEYIKLILSPRLFENAFAIGNVFNLPKKSKILDFGCAESILALQLAIMGYDVTGVDVQDYLLTHPNLRFMKGDFFKMEFGGEFDCVVAISSIEHVGLGFYGDPLIEDGDLKAMEKISKLLKPGGILIITVPFGKDSSDWERSYDEKDLKKLLNNFKILRSRYYKNYKDNWVEVDKKEIGDKCDSVFCAVCKPKR